MREFEHICGTRAHVSCMAACSNDPPVRLDTRQTCGDGHVYDCFLWHSSCAWETEVAALVASPSLTIRKRDITQYPGH
jgi:hypothetical protein